jgi:hypothetical protein
MADAEPAASQRFLRNSRREIFGVQNPGLGRNTRLPIKQIELMFHRSAAGKIKICARSVAVVLAA